MTTAICPCGINIRIRANSSGLCRKCYHANWTKNNKEDQINYKKNYRIQNKEKLTKQTKEWRQNNKEKQNIYYANKRKDPQYRLVHNLRSRLYDFLRGNIKHKNTESLTGCSFDELKLHLESKFKEGMTWDNYGTYWVVDHIVPFISISPENTIELERICHYSNLQPLEYELNSSKATQDKLWKKQNS